MFNICKNCKQDSESEEIVEWVFVESFIYLKARLIALASTVYTHVAA